MIILSENSTDLILLEHTSISDKHLCELRERKHSILIDIIVSEHFPDGLALIVSSVGSLPHLLKDDVLKLLHSLGSNVRVLANSPSAQNNVDEVLVLLCRQACIQVSVVVHESGLVNYSGCSVSQSIKELIEDILSCLVSSPHSRMRSSVVLSLEPGHAHVSLRTENFISILDSGESLLVEVVPEGVDELPVVDLLVSIEVEGVEESCDLLSRKKHSDLRSKTLELYFVEGS